MVCARVFSEEPRVGQAVALVATSFFKGSSGPEGCKDSEFVLKVLVVVALCSASSSTEQV